MRDSELNKIEPLDPNMQKAVDELEAEHPGLFRDLYWGRPGFINLSPADKAEVRWFVAHTLTHDPHLARWLTIAVEWGQINA